MREYARLNLSEFEELPDYASLREIIETRLDTAAIEHDIASIDGHDHLIFRVEDAPEVDEAFKELDGDADAACERAVKERGRDLNAERDAEPLEAEGAAAREASQAASGSGQGRARDGAHRGGRPVEARASRHRAHIPRTVRSWQHLHGARHGGGKYSVGSYPRLHRSVIASSGALF